MYNPKMTTPKKPPASESPSSPSEKPDGSSGAVPDASSVPSGNDLRELAVAMNRLADSLNRLTDMAREAKAENPDWAKFPSTLIDLCKRLTILSTRLR